MNIGLSLGDFATSSAQIGADTMKFRQENQCKFQTMMQDLHDVSDGSRDLLEKMSTILPILASDRRILSVSKPALWHTGLPLNNILVSATDPTHILGLIGWRCSKILPLFLHTRFPKFLTTPKSYSFISLKSLLSINILCQF